MNNACLDVISLIERLHRRFLEVVKRELDGMGIYDINNVQAMMLFVAMLLHATGAPAFSAASSGDSLVSQCTARKRWPVPFPAASDASQTSGGAMTSGCISLASSDIIGVLVTPPGTRTLTVTPVPSRSFAMIALSASSAALEGP